jgi:hypothetical protein
MRVALLATGASHRLIVSAPESVYVSISVHALQQALQPFQEKEEASLAVPGKASEIAQQVGLYGRLIAPIDLPQGSYCGVTGRLEQFVRVHTRGPRYPQEDSCGRVLDVPFFQL